MKSILTSFFLAAMAAGSNGEANIALEGKPLPAEQILKDNRFRAVGGKLKFKRGTKHITVRLVELTRRDDGTWDRLELAQNGFSTGPEWTEQDFRCYIFDASGINFLIAVNHSSGGGGMVKRIFVNEYAFFSEPRMQDGRWIIAWKTPETPPPDEKEISVMLALEFTGK